MSREQLNRMEAGVSKPQLPGGLNNHSNVPLNIHPPNTQAPVLDNHNWKPPNPMENQDAQDTVNHIQQMLNQLNSRGVQSILVTVGPFGDIGLHGSQKGQLFLKENSDIGDRFAKMCTDHDVWTLLGAQKRFLEIGRANQNKSGGAFNDKGDYPLDFSNERGNYFSSQTASNDRTSSQDSFVQGILSQGGSQNKSFQPNTFLPGGFSQYEPRPNYHAGSFFQGGFTQGLPGSESFPQPSFMTSGVDAPPNNNLGNTMMNPPQTSSSMTSPSTNVSDKNNSMAQCEADLIKEMLNSAPVQEVIYSGKGNKEKSPKVKIEKDKEKVVRKRERRPETWQRNIKKKLKTEGKSYINSKGKLIPAKVMLPVDCSNCKQRCQEKISEETRKKIFEWFWKLGSYTAQKEFVVSRVTQVATKTNKRRSVHRLFSFEINGKYESVCKPFFSKTLGIGDSYIFKAFEQKARDLFVQDGRGKHAPVNKTSESQIDDVHNHLELYLSEYPPNKPLPKNIHAVKWYDEYVTNCTEEDKKPVSKHIYRKIFQEFARKFPPGPDKAKDVAGTSRDPTLSNSSMESSV